ncbi:virulence factor MVIN family protein [Colwellia psychrerythraea]|uniref:Virulence factor MVIN family protein n=2 Tax=Colwellia psychrerythraea TaxID=28229 RepID=A0A099KJY2_COLPS|nr:virulence factor MVIN family protein [Colwellia psychrerythraea]
MGGATLFFKGLSLGKEIYIANSFGVSSALEAYLIAFVYVGFPISVLIVPFQTSFIASLAEKSIVESGSSYINKVFSAVISISIGIIVLWVITLYLLSELIFVNHELVMDKVILLLPFVFFNSINLILYGVLQFKGKFSVNGYLPSLSPVLVLVGLLIFEVLFGIVSVDIIVMAIALSSLIEFYILRKLLDVRLDLKGLRETIHTTFKKSYFLMLSAVVMASAPMIEQFYSSSLQQSGVVLLRYASIIPLAISGVFSTVVAVVILPYFSKLSLNTSNVALRSQYWNILAGYACVIVVLYFVLSLFSNYLLNTIYSSAITSGVELSTLTFNFNLYLISGGFFCLTNLGIRLLSSMHKGKIIFVGSLCSLAIQLFILSFFGKSVGLSVVPISIICYFLTSFIGINFYIYCKVKI